MYSPITYAYASQTCRKNLCHHIFGIDSRFSNKGIFSWCFTFVKFWDVPDKFNKWSNMFPKMCQLSASGWNWCSFQNMFPLHSKLKLFPIFPSLRFQCFAFVDKDNRWQTFWVSPRIVRSNFGGAAFTIQRNILRTFSFKKYQQW